MYSWHCSITLVFLSLMFLKFKKKKMTQVAAFVDEIYCFLNMTILAVYFSCIFAFNYDVTHIGMLVISLMDLKL